MKFCKINGVLLTGLLIAVSIGFIPGTSQGQSWPVQRRAALAAWENLPPRVLGCLRRNFGVFGRVLGWRYGVYPNDPTVARDVRFCETHPFASGAAPAPGGSVAGSPQPTAAARGAASASTRLAMFQKGLDDRTAWETWFNGLSGDEKIGAFYWSGQRSLPHPGSCDQMSEAFRLGCREATTMLLPSDALRRADPAYKSGWNAYTAPAAADQAPALPQSASALGPAPAATPSTGDDVPLEVAGGAYTVPVIVNGAVKLNFTVDSGATDVLIPVDTVLTLLRAGTLAKGDFIGNDTYTLADGSRLQSMKFMLHEVRIGNQVLENVVATIGPLTSSPLLGQSFLSRFGSWTLDNSRHMLVLGAIQQGG